MRNLEVLAALIGKNNLRGPNISLYTKLVLIAKSRYANISITEPFDSLFTLHDTDDRTYTYVTVKPTNIKKVVGELIAHKFPLKKVVIFSIEFVEVPKEITLHVFSKDQINQIINSINVSTEVKLNFSLELFNKVRNDLNIDDIKELVQFQTPMPEIDKKHLKACMHTLKYIGEYDLVVGEFINADVLCALSAYIIYHQNDKPITKVKDSIKYHRL